MLHFESWMRRTYFCLIEEILFHLLCFFLQAEDGIRDRDVTGVQTCALPIFRKARFGPYELDFRAGELRKNGRSEERREGKSVDLGGRRIIKKKTTGKRE